MTIRKRLILSYIAMVLIPIILIFAIGAALSASFFGRDESGGRTAGVIENGRGVPPIWQTFDSRDKLFSAIQWIAEFDPGLLSDKPFLQSADQALHDLQSGLVILKQGTMLYASPSLDAEKLDALLAASDSSEGSPWKQRAHGGYDKQSYEFKFPDGRQGTLILLSDLNPFFGRMARFLPVLFLSLLLVVGLTNGLLTYFVSRSIIKPLYALKQAAERIKEGDLDQRVQLRSKDEFGKVGEAFEEMRERLKHSLAMQIRYEENRKELLSNITHDLKTPITGLKACLEALRDGIADTDEKRDKYIRMMDSKATAMDRMIDELFLFSKLDLKGIPFHYEPTDMYGYVSGCVEELRTDPRLKDVRLEFHSGIDGIFILSIDREKMRRAIMNIVDNSLNHMNHENKRISFALTREEDAVTLAIGDNGPGIEQDALPYIFERFYRAEPSRNSLTGGSGLGLSIVKQIVEEHGGTVEARSEPGQGVTISLSLPLQDHSEPDGEPS